MFIHSASASQTVTDEAWTIEDMMQIATVTDVCPSSDGTKVIYTVTKPLITDTKSEMHSQAYEKRLDESEPLLLMSEEASSSVPRWSPDETRIAFLSDSSGINSIWEVPSGGGDALQITDTATPVLDLAWSPQGDLIAFTMPEPEPEEQITREEERNDRVVVGENPLMISLWTIKAEPGAQPVRIAGGNCSVSGFSWAPDGSSIAFSHQKTAEIKDLDSQDISVVWLSDGNISSLTTAVAPKANPVFSPDGNHVAFTAYPVGSPYFFNYSVYIAEIDGGDTTRLAPTYDRFPSLFGWSADQSFLWFTEIQGEQNKIGMLPVDGSEPVYIGPLDGIIINPMGNNAKLSWNSGMIGFSWENATSPDEGYITPVGAFSPVQVTDVNDGIRSLPVATTEIVSWESSDGLKIEGVLTYPLDYEEGQKYPLIVFLHGGPASASFENYYDCINTGCSLPLPVISSQGYAVIMPNIRGSFGRGIDFRLANVGDWGGMDYEDLMSGVDFLIAEGIADPDRLGIMGHSYGGYMTDWTVTRTDRFKAAVSYAGMFDLVSMLTSDAYLPIPAYMNTSVWEDYDTFKSHSAISSVKNVTTPVIFIQGEEDSRVPPTQALEMYTALDMRGIPVKMVIYPREGHGISEPKHVMDYWRESMNWFDKYL